MKIFHIIPTMEIGGAESFLEKIVILSPPTEHHEIICLKRRGKIGDRLVANGFKVHQLNLNNIFVFPFCFFKLVNFLRSENPAVVQTWMYHSDLLGGIAAKFASCKKIIWSIRCTNTLTLRGSSISGYFSMKLCSWLSRLIPHKIICVAHKAMEQHIQYGYDSSKMLVVQNGFHLNTATYNRSYITKIRDKISIDEDSLVIGSVARFNAYKDHLNFINAALKVINKFPKTIFLMVGTDITKSNVELFNIIQSAGMEKNFRLLGEYHEMDDIYHAMDIFCLHSRSEGFPNVLGEAMSSGLPCISTDVGDASELLGNNGMIIDPENYIQLSNAMEKIILLSNEERMRMGENGMKRIKAKYSINKALNIYSQLYASK